jgi:hypothetical protein
MAGETAIDSIIGIIAAWGVRRSASSVAARCASAKRPCIMSE